MTRTLSIYLDLVRLLAACVVFLSHAGTQRISGGLFYQFAAFGEAAVDVFFVLSGFVIAHAVASRETTLRGYAVSRVARLYSVVLPALALGWLMDALGQAINPALYAVTPNFTGPATPMQLLSSALFLDQTWWRAAQPGSNLPFWSLGFEVWYYIAFGALMFAPRPWNWLAAALAMLLAGPKIALLLPLWLLGVASYHVCRNNWLPRRAGWALCLGPLVAFALWPDPFGRTCFPFQPFSAEPACLAALRLDLGFGLLVATHLLGVHALSDRLAPLMERGARPITWLAGASFTLYLLHYPLIHFMVAAAPWPATDWATRALVFLATPVVVLAVAAVTERRKQAWRRAVTSVLRIKVGRA